MRKTIGIIILLLTLIASAVGSYFYFTNYNYQSLANRLISRISIEGELTSPFIAAPTPKVLLYEQYTIPNLRHYPYQTSEITLIEEQSKSDEFTTYLFKYQTMGKKMTGTANIPNQGSSQEPLPVIVMVRGYATPGQYYPGFGTRNAAAVFARNGYVTLAPDFFSFGNSDPEPDDSWEARFVKPINIIELIKSIQEKSEVVMLSAEDSVSDTQPEIINLNPEKIGMWGHSNGGQIAISVLQILSQPIPTTTWAPVTAPFPYSILFFSRTAADEGKETRAWLAMFERDYDVFEFTITQHLDKLTGPLQIHHGGRDKDALQDWSDTFATKIEQENLRRKKLEQDSPLKQLNTQQEATTEANAEESANLDPETTLSLLKKPINFAYFVYPQADHNLQPAENWQRAVNRDLDFFKNNL